MDDRHDDVEDWLSGRIEPLYPPPGTLELIRRRARRRKYRKLAVAAGAGALVVAAAVTVPQVVNLNVLAPPSNGVYAAGRAASVSPRAGGGITESSAASHPATFPSPSATPTAPAVPADFRPTSVTFVGTATGWVMGQAGTPGHCATAFCTSVARTDNAGNSWTGVPAPVTGAADGATGVSQIRFLDLDNGWAFGPQLWATHDGGQDWVQIGTRGQRVTGLETVGDRVFAVFATCTGGGAAFAAGCTSFTLYSSPAGADHWAPVGAATSGLAGGAPGGGKGSASLSLTETRGYLLAPDGSLFEGSVSGGAAWHLVARIPAACDVGPAQQDGQPGGALLGAEPGEDVILACTPGQSGGNPVVDTSAKHVYASGDGGASWRMITTAPAQGVATSLAASPAETVILATDRGIDVLPAGSATWKQLTLAGAPAGGFAFVGMTTPQQGVALPADPQSGTVWFTFDGGRTWAPSTVSGS